MLNLTSISSKSIVQQNLQNMKSYFYKIATSLLIICISLSAVAQQAQTTDNKTNVEKLKDIQIKKANELVENIAASVKLTDDQRTKLQASMLECIVKSDNARAAVKGDDTKLIAWRDAKIADIKARMKTILTPAQYAEVLKNEGSK